MIIKGWLNAGRDWWDWSRGWKFRGAERRRAEEAYETLKFWYQHRYLNWPVCHSLLIFVSAPIFPSLFLRNKSLGLTFKWKGGVIFAAAVWLPQKLCSGPASRLHADCLLLRTWWVPVCRRQRGASCAGLPDPRFSRRTELLWAQPYCTVLRCVWIKIHHLKQLIFHPDSTKLSAAEVFWSHSAFWALGLNDAQRLIQSALLSESWICSKDRINETLN